MFYGFFCATLPTLNCGVPAEISLEEFDRMVRCELSEKNFSRLCSWDDRENTPKVRVYREMRDFDRFLKLRIAEKRQEKLGTSFVLPQVDEYHSEVDYALPGAAASGDPLERERMIDLKSTTSKPDTNWILPPFAVTVCVWLLWKNTANAAAETAILSLKRQSTNCPERSVIYNFLNWKEMIYGAE